MPSHDRASSSGIYSRRAKIIIGHIAVTGEYGQAKTVFLRCSIPPPPNANYYLRHSTNSDIFGWKLHSFGDDYEYR